MVVYFFILEDVFVTWECSFAFDSIYLIFAGLYFVFGNVYLVIGSLILILGSIYFAFGSIGKLQRALGVKKLKTERTGRTGKI